jgi:thiol-disulfide isomerase/thioredoxin
VLGAACRDEPAPAGPPPSRFAAVRSDQAGKAAASFCEQTFPAQGAEARRWTAPPEREVPEGKGKAAPAAAGWTWVNLWASWCQPCIKEVPLLGRWGKSLNEDGIAMRYEFWSIDEEESDLRSALHREFPGRIRWLRGPDDLGPFLDSLGVSRDSAIPIHALVDAKGMLRCVRVGSVGEEVYGSVKAILGGG